MNKCEELLLIENLSVSYGSIKAVKNVNLKVNRGETVALIGSNGAGKSTLLKAILNIQHPAGKVIFKGKNITSKTTDKIVASGISLIPEGHINFNSMSVYENLLLGSYHNKGGKQVNISKIFSYFPVLEARKEQIAGTLSGGEQQMLSIGRSLLAEPDLILIDEPSLGLAPKIVKKIFSLLSTLNQQGYTILLSEQNVSKSLEVADRGYVIDTGQVVLEGRAEELKNNERVREAYLGYSM